MHVERTRLLACLSFASVLTLVGCIPGTIVHTARWSLPASALPPTADSGDCQVRISADGFGGLESYIERTQLVGETAAQSRARCREELLKHAEDLTAGQSISATTAFLDTAIAPNPFPPRAEAQRLQIYLSCVTDAGYFACSVPMAVRHRGTVVCPLRRFPWQSPGEPPSGPAALEIDYTSTPCTRSHGDCGRGWFVRMLQLRTVDAPQ